eukprot:418407-Alexandrium_andersonii.AAC.1
MAGRRWQLGRRRCLQAVCCPPDCSATSWPTSAPTASTRKRTMWARPCASRWDPTWALSTLRPSQVSSMPTLTQGSTLACWRAE